MTSPPDYRGRFAPSPTGPLHFGSLVAAVGSYLDAKHHHGTWLVRMEDLDTPRCIPGAADDILRTLEAYGLQWDGEILYQSRRSEAYEEALRHLQQTRAIYPCACTRKEISDSALNGIEGPIYPGTCRNGIPPGKEARAWRIRTDIPGTAFSSGKFEDLIQGEYSQNLQTEIGDFVVKRADGLFAYQLAVVVDDAMQNITHIVRGADLLASTPRQIYLQELLGLPTPQYMHLPVANSEAGEKLSKQTLAPALKKSDAPFQLFKALQFLQQNPPTELIQYSSREILDWAIPNWNPHALCSYGSSAPGPQ
jgi:glutamyl-Q tRNA(Asp) synthetase